MEVKFLSSSGRLPKRADVGAAGYDLYAAYDKVIPSKGRALIGTGIAIRIPTGTYGRVASRSGLSFKYGLEVGGGVIDESYRGEVGVILYNHSEQDYEVKDGDRIAQLILERIETPEVKEVLELKETERGNSGYGSSGK